MKYEWKPLAEAGWFVGVAVLVYLAEMLTTFDPEAVATDWRPYLVAAGGGCVRAAAGALLAVLPRGT